MSRCSRQIASFVGRRVELEALNALVDQSVPLITLVGPAGIGKTRLVQRLVETRVRDDSVFCDLRGVLTAEALAVSLAETLGGELDGGVDPPALFHGVGTHARIAGMPGRHTRQF